MPVLIDTLALIPTISQYQNFTIHHNKLLKNSKHDPSTVVSRLPHFAQFHLIKLKSDQTHKVIILNETTKGLCTRSSTDLGFRVFLGGFGGHTSYLLGCFFLLLKYFIFFGCGEVRFQWYSDTCGLWQVQFEWQLLSFKITVWCWAMQFAVAAYDDNKVN